MAAAEPSAIQELIAWLDEAQRRLRASVIEHDLYHAGEINRMRALGQKNDSWAYESA